MKKFNKIILATLLLSSVAFANKSNNTLIEVLSDTNTFIGVSVSHSNLNVKKEDNSGSVVLSKKLKENGTSFSIEAGYHYLDNIDISLNYKRVNLDDVGLDNIYISSIYKLKKQNNFIPYIGANIGYSQLSWDTNPISSINAEDVESSSILIGVKVGTLYTINKNLSLNLNYTLDYMKHKTKLEDFTKKSTLIHNYLSTINFGIRYSF